MPITSVQVFSGRPCHGLLWDWISGLPSTNHRFVLHGHAIWVGRCGVLFARSWNYILFRRSCELTQSLALNGQREGGREGRTDGGRVLGRKGGTDFGETDRRREGQMDGWTGRQADQWTDRQTDRHTDGRMDGWTDRQRNRETERRMDRWLDVWNDKNTHCSQYLKTYSIRTIIALKVDCVHAKKQDIQIDLQKSFH